MGNAHLVLFIQKVARISATQFAFTVLAPLNSGIAQPQMFQMWVVDAGKPCGQASWVKVQGPVVSWPVL